MQGLHFGDLYKYFPDAIVLGLSDKDTGRSVLNPDPATVIGPDDNLVLMRPSSVPSAVYQPLKKALHTDLGAPITSWPPLHQHDDLLVDICHLSSLWQTMCLAWLTLENAVDPAYTASTRGLKCLMTTCLEALQHAVKHICWDVWNDAEG